MGDILNMAIADAKEILNGGFSVELTITPFNILPVTINGLATRHSQSFDTNGLPISSENAHCSFFEKDLNDEGIVTRNAKGQLNITDWKLSFTDTAGIGNYKISEPAPDRTLGIIRCKLSFFE